MNADDQEILPRQQREELLRHLAGLRPLFPKLELPDSMIKGFLNPPGSPEECIFARTTVNVTADLRSRITPCQFGGTPDCSQCGCAASAGLKAVGDYRLFGFVPLKKILFISERIGKDVNKLRSSMLD